MARSIWELYGIHQYLVRLSALPRSIAKHLIRRGFVFIFGVFESFYQLSYLPSESASSISWIGTVQSALLSIIGVLAGPLYDLGLYRSMMISGACLVLLGLFMLSLSTEYYQIFLTQGICIGIGGGLLYVPSLALVTGTFKKNRSLAMGVVTCGIGIGKRVTFCWLSD